MLTYWLRYVGGVVRLVTDKRTAEGLKNRYLQKNLYEGTSWLLGIYVQPSDRFQADMVGTKDIVRFRRLHSARRD